MINSPWVSGDHVETQGTRETSPRLEGRPSRAQQTLLRKPLHTWLLSHKAFKPREPRSCSGSYWCPVSWHRALEGPLPRTQDLDLVPTPFRALTGSGTALSTREEKHERRGPGLAGGPLRMHSPAVGLSAIITICSCVEGGGYPSSPTGALQRLA